MTGDCHVGICGSRGLQCPRLPGAAGTQVAQPRSSSCAYDLVAGEDGFVAVTGVTLWILVHGFRTSADGATTESIVMRSSSGTVRRIESNHALDKLAGFSGVDYR